MTYKDDTDIRDACARLTITKVSVGTSPSMHVCSTHEHSQVTGAFLLPTLHVQY